MCTSAVAKLRFACYVASWCSISLDPQNTDFECNIHAIQASLDPLFLPLCYPVRVCVCLCVFVQVYRLLRQQGHNVVAVFTVPDDPVTGRPDPLAEQATSDRLPVLKYSRWRKKKVSIPEVPLASWLSPSSSFYSLSSDR